MRGPRSQADSRAAWGSGDAHVQSTATRRPRPQAIGACGAPHLTLGFVSKPSPSAPWARGLLSVFWERGSQTCLPAAHSVAKPAGRTTHLHQQGIQDPREGPSLARRTTKDLLRSGPLGGLTRSGDINAGKTSRGSRDASHDDRHQAGARRAPVRAASLFPLWC